MSLRMANKKNCDSEIPEDVMEAFVRALLPDIRRFYESDEGKAIFEEWNTKKDKIDKNIA